MDVWNTIDHLTAENAKLRAEVEKMTGVFEKWRRCAEIGACGRCQTAEAKCTELRKEIARLWLVGDELKKEIWSLKKYQWAFRQIAARLDGDGGQAQTGNPDADLERIDKAACEWLSSFEESKELKAENERLKAENEKLKTILEGINPRVDAADFEQLAEIGRGILESRTRMEEIMARVAAGEKE